jgi:hypothetical protein
VPSLWQTKRHAGDPPDAKLAIDRLAVIHFRENNDDDAEKVFHSSLAIRERTLGPEHSDVASTPNNLGLLAIRHESYLSVKLMWPVRECETQALLLLFHASWRGGLDKHEALREAQLKECETVRER